jgi:(p)ppGpp synthase/HD superfamily hydrolase
MRGFDTPREELEAGWEAEEDRLNAELENRARQFATEAHLGQVRKYTGEPYITHPAAVVALVKTVRHTPEMVCAAWLHDVVEDCGVPLQEITSRFGHKVADLVEQLTDVSKPSDGNRSKRKAIDRRHTAAASSDAKTIKLADLIDNSRSILERDPEFAKVYLAEKRLLLEEALLSGDPVLFTMAGNICRLCS